jgi:hypothetical protein
MRMLSAILMSACALILTSCGDDDDDGPTGVEGPDIELLAPNGGDVFNPGTDVNISWSIAKRQPITVDIGYVAEGILYAGIAEDVTGTSFTWTVPSENLYGVKVKVVARDQAGNTGEDESDRTFAIVPVSARGFVTSEICKHCHDVNYTEHRNSGHSWKIQKIEAGQPPSYPFSEVPSPPAAFTWNDISYVIGGYGWKARFMNAEGYILTTGFDGVQDAQYNLPRADLGGGLPSEWVTYLPNQASAKQYTCGACHTTGWQIFAENGGVHQDGLVGILGTWEEPGITCERCHAPEAGGATHVATQSTEDINIDRRSELCGECHFRDTNHNILASPPFILHYAQYDEMISARHVGRACTDCHDPHIGVRYDNAQAGGIKIDCQTPCHTTITSVNHLEPVDCIQCHMPRATKSARAVQTYQGDVRTHIFKINPGEPVPGFPDSVDVARRDDPDGMFYEEDGSTFSRGFVTLDFVCYQCHTDPETGEGGGGSVHALSDLAKRAVGIHD